MLALQDYHKNITQRLERDKMLLHQNANTEGTTKLLCGVCALTSTTRTTTAFSPTSLMARSRRCSGVSALSSRWSSVVTNSSLRGGSGAVYDQHESLLATCLLPRMHFYHWPSSDTHLMHLSWRILSTCPEATYCLYYLSNPFYNNAGNTISFYIR